MQIFDENKNRIGTLTGFKERSITTTLDSGDKEMSFQYPATGEKVDALKPECYLRTKTDEFVLKQIDESDDFNTYTATLNVEELESKVFTTGFEMIEKTIRECLENAFAGTGWSIRNCEITKRRTIRETDQQTGWTILQKALSTYRCECIIDTLQKAIDIYDRIGEDKGAYFIEGLNLKKVTRKSDTYDFYTRIYPIGKDGLTPETVLGKDYIDNHQYSNKVKACVWKDERYTEVQSLIEDAEAKLEEISKPYKQYTAEVQDLAKQSDIYKNILDYGIGDTVTLISKQKGIKDKQRIVKIVEYPESPEKNTVELSNVNKTFAEIQQEEVDAETDRATTEEDNLSNDIADEAEERKSEDSKITVRVDKNENSIQTEVADRTRENLELGTKVSQTAHKVSVSAIGGDKYVGITIQLYDENGNLIDTTSGAANITITGFVTFNDLANAGSTTINGANITTGTISCDRLSGGTIKGQTIILDEGWDLLKDTAGRNIYALLSAWMRTNNIAKYSNKNDWFGEQRFQSQITLNGDISANGIKGRSSSAGANVRCQDGTNAWLAISAASSRRYKHDISDITDPELNPHRLLELHARQYTYNFDYLDPEDSRYGEVVCGFVAEEILEKYPVACEFNEYGIPENWDARYIIPPMLSLIQEQHREINQLKMNYFNLKGELETIKNMILQMEGKEMLRQQKTTNLNATLTADVGNGEEKAYVYFSATVQADGKHSVTYTVQDEALFSANKEDFDKERKAFEKSVEENMQ